MSEVDPKADKEKINQLLEAAFLEGPLFFMGYKLRPLSLGTLVVARRLLLSVILTGGDLNGLSGDELVRQLQLYIGMQTMHPDEVMSCAVNGREDTLRMSVALDQEQCAILIDYLRRQRDLIEAVRCKVTGGKAVSEGIFLPSWVASLVQLVSGSGKGWPEEFVMWELPYCRALAYEHTALRALGHKTIKPELSGGAVEEQVKKADEAAKQAAQERVDDEW